MVTAHFSLHSLTLLAFVFLDWFLSATAMPGHRAPLAETYALHQIWLHIELVICILEIEVQATTTALNSFQLFLPLSWRSLRHPTFWYQHARYTTCSKLWIIIDIVFHIINIALSGRFHQISLIVVIFVVFWYVRNLNRLIWKLLLHRWFFIQIVEIKAFWISNLQIDTLTPFNYWLFGQFLNTLHWLSWQWTCTWSWSSFLLLLLWFRICLFPLFDFFGCLSFEIGIYFLKLQIFNFLINFFYFLAKLMPCLFICLK